MKSKHSVCLSFLWWQVFFEGTRGNILHIFRASEPFEKYCELNYNFVSDFKKGPIVHRNWWQRGDWSWFSSANNQKWRIYKLLSSWSYLSIYFSLFRKNPIMASWFIYFLQSWNTDWCILYFWACTSDDWWIVNKVRIKHPIAYKQRFTAFICLSKNAIRLK